MRVIAGLDSESVLFTFVSYLTIWIYYSPTPLRQND